MQFGMIFSLIFALIAVIFAVQNTAIVRLNFFIWQFDLPLAILMILALTIGAVFAMIFTLPGWLRWKRSDRIHKKELTGLEDNLSKYRADLIDTQNKNKDLRQKILELEEAKETLEAAQADADREIKDMQNAISNANLSVAEAEQARKEAIEARDELDTALKKMEEKMKFSEQKADIMRTVIESGSAISEIAPATPNFTPMETGSAWDEEPTIESESAAAESITDENETNSVDFGETEPKEEGEEPKKRFGLW